MSQICDACGNEFDSSADVCTLCGAPPSTDDAEEQNRASDLADRIRSYLPTDTDRLYHATIVLTAGYAVSAILGMLTTNTDLFLFSLVLAIGSVISMYFDLFGLDTRLYDTRPALWVVGALLMYFLVVPIYIYKRARYERSPGG